MSDAARYLRMRVVDLEQDLVDKPTLKKREDGKTCYVTRLAYETLQDSLREQNIHITDLERQLAGLLLATEKGLTPVGEHIARLERQRDALVEAMKRLATIKVDGYGCCYYWDGRRIAEEILAEIDKDK